MGAVPASDGRKDLLAWVVKHMQNLKASKADVNPLVKPTLVYIEDKSSEVRHLAEQLLKDIAEKIGVEAIKKQCSDLKPASKLVLEPLLQQIRDSNKVAKKASTPVRFVKLFVNECHY